LYQQIKDRRELVARLLITRPLFVENSVTIFRLRERRARPRDSPGRAAVARGPAIRASRKSIVTVKPA
jgi:hypothetical protein